MITGFDTAANTTDSLPAIAAAGYKWIGRYYSRNQHKNLTLAEAQAAARVGLALVSIWEAAGDHLSAFSQQQGLADGLDAVKQAKDCHQPEASTIYFAVDFDTAPEELEQIKAYFVGVREGLKVVGAVGTGYHVGVYGSGLVCQTLLAAGLVSRCWLAAALSWRGSQEFLDSGRWQIRQLPQQIGPPGVPFQIDPDETDGPISFGSWVPDRGVPAPAPAPAPVPAPPPIESVIDQILAYSHFPAGVEAYQQRRGLLPDGKIGPKTLRAIGEDLR